MKQVGSSGPQGLSGGITPPPPPFRAGGSPAARGPRKLVVPILIGLAVFLGANRLLHHENRYEKLATNVTKAIAANDMHPVDKEFNALTRVKLADRGTVGRLSDFVNADGALKSVKEDTPSGSTAGYHHFVATFATGKRSEDLTVDADGKIADFHVRPEADAAQGTAPQ